VIVSKIDVRVSLSSARVTGVSPELGSASATKPRGTQARTLAEDLSELQTSQWP